MAAAAAEEEAAGDRSGGVRVITPVANTSQGRLWLLIHLQKAPLAKCGGGGALLQL